MHFASALLKILFYAFIAKVVSQSASGKNPCDSATQILVNSPPGAFTLSCTPNGWYKAKQCSDSGYCWCVFPHSGQQLSSSVIPPTFDEDLVCPACLVQAANALPQAGSADTYVPQCDSNGNFQQLQFFASTGYTWCVNPYTGEKINGTDTPPGKGPLNCGVPPPAPPQTYRRWFYRGVTGTDNGYLTTYAPNSPPKNPCDISLDNHRMRNSYHSHERSSRHDFVPSCTKNGWFDYKQCQGNNGQCWCTFPQTGVEVTGTRVLPGAQQNLACPLCLMKQADSLPAAGIIGTNVPQCDSNGNFYVKQFDSSSGNSWCVNPITGDKVAGTDTTAGSGPLKCTQQAQKNPCQAAVDSNQNMPGSFIPQCTKNGWYAAQQCQGTNGQCWCVFPDSGREIGKTRNTGAVTCPACITQQADALPPFNFAGAYVPQCDKTGNFIEMQRNPSTGFSYCVNRISGAKLVGSDTPPGKNLYNCYDGTFS